MLEAIEPALAIEGTALEGVGEITEGSCDSLDTGGIWFCGAMLGEMVGSIGEAEAPYFLSS